MLLFNIALRPTFFLLPFSGLFFPPYFLPPPPPPFRSSSSLKPSQFHPLPNSSPGAKCCPPGSCPDPPPASVHRSSLRPTPHVCVCCCSCDGLLPPFPPLACTKVPVGSWLFCPLHVPPRLYVPTLSSLSSPPNIGIVRFWCLCRVDFHKNMRGQGASTPLQSHYLFLAPRYLAMTAPFRIPGSPPSFPPPPLLPCCHNPIPVGR